MFAESGVKESFRGFTGVPGLPRLDHELVVSDELAGEAGRVVTVFDRVGSDGQMQREFDSICRSHLT